MAPKKEMAPIGGNPIDANIRFSFQSKAVSKYSNFPLNAIYAYLKFFCSIGWEAVKLWD